MVQPNEINPFKGKTVDPSPQEITDRETFHQLNQEELSNIVQKEIPAGKSWSASVKLLRQEDPVACFIACATSVASNQLLNLSVTQIEEKLTNEARAQGILVDRGSNTGQEYWSSINALLQQFTIQLEFIQHNPVEMLQQMILALKDERPVLLHHWPSGQDGGSTWVVVHQVKNESGQITWGVMRPHVGRFDTVSNQEMIQYLSQPGTVPQLAVVHYLTVGEQVFKPLDRVKTHVFTPKEDDNPTVFRPLNPASSRNPVPGFRPKNNV